MHKALNEAAARVLQLAGDESRRLNHQYIGTEHLLLGLLLEGSSASAGSLQRLGVALDSLRGEIEKLVARGPEAAMITDLPLTPRAKRAIQFASELADNLGLPQIGPEHLLIGLLREPDGVAGIAMRNLGVDLRSLYEECLKIRKQQMRIVERAIRPIMAGAKHKRKMREEMLAHLSAIYDEEFDRLNDPTAALDAAAKRFGDPVELACELQDSIPASERWAYRIEHWLGWRAPESVLRMMTRTSFLSFCIITVGMGLPIFGVILVQGWDQRSGVALRMLAAIALLTPMAQFALGISYYRMRDSFWGVFGAPKSLARTVLWGCVIAMAVIASGLGLIFILEGRSLRLLDSLQILTWAGFWTAIACFALVRMHGPVEIRDTVWATLDLNTTS